MCRRNTKCEVRSVVKLTRLPADWWRNKLLLHVLISLGSVWADSSWIRSKYVLGFKFQQTKHFVGERQPVATFGLML